MRRDIARIVDALVGSDTPFYRVWQGFLPIPGKPHTMRLEPVYLVTTSTASKTMPTRRAFLIAGAAAGSGILAGLLIGRTTIAAEQGMDPIVSWARSASSEPDGIAELRAHYHGLLHALATAPEDPGLWRSVRLLVDDLESRDAGDDAALIAASLRQGMIARPGRCPDEATLLERLRRLELR